MPFRLTNIDAYLLDKVNLTLGGTKVQFQFPPIIKSDSKSFNWNEIDIKNIEPMATFQGAKARVIDLKWVYVVTGQSGWSAKKISDMVKSIRGFFYQQIMAQFAGDNPPAVTPEASTGGPPKPVNNYAKSLIVRFNAYNVVGIGTQDGQIAFRSEGVDITHSDVIIDDNSGTYPLKTELSMKLKLWTQGEGADKKPMDATPGLSPASYIMGNTGWY